jgi:deoxyadenosine/deoxycytidine kinase
MITRITQTGHKRNADGTRMERGLRHPRNLRSAYIRNIPRNPRNLRSALICVIRVICVQSAFNLRYLPPSVIKHVAIAGNIGSGKTTLAEKLARHYNWLPLFEAVDQNPYLRDFYSDMTRWAFHLQIYFLNSRFNQVRTIRNSARPVVQDRTIYEDAYIFAANLHRSGHISPRDYQCYLGIFDSMMHFVAPPDLLIYLRADIPKLVAQIAKRNRDFEFSIRLEYLKTLNEHYEAWIESYDLGKLLIVDVNQLDFIERVEDFSLVVSKIDLELNSLFT